MQMFNASLLGKIMECLLLMRERAAALLEKEVSFYWVHE